MNPFDPNLIEKLFGELDISLEEMMGGTDPNEEELSQEELDRIKRQNDRRLDRIKTFWGRIPSKERAMLSLKYLKGMSQTAIGRFYNISQGAVSYRINRALERIRLFNKQISVDEDQIAKDFADFFQEPVVAKVMYLMWFSSNQSETARVLGISQFKARSKWQNGFAILYYFHTGKLLKETVQRKTPYSGEKMERFLEGIPPEDILGEDSQAPEEEKAWAEELIKTIERTSKRPLDDQLPEDLKRRLSIYMDVFTEIKMNPHILTEKLHKWKKAPRII